MSYLIEKIFDFTKVILSDFLGILIVHKSITGDKQGSECHFFLPEKSAE